MAKVSAPKKKFNQNELLIELAESNDFFDMLVDMIPSKLYIKSSNTDGYNPKYHKTNAEDSKESRRAKAKQAKRRKLDPNAATGTVAQASQGVVVQTPIKRASHTTAVVSPNTNSNRIENLRAKLHAKLEEKAANRPKPDASGVSKRAARRAEKARRKEEAIRKKQHSKVNTTDKKYVALNSGANGTTTDAAADLQGLDFGRLAGLNPDRKESYGKTNKALANLGKTKNLQKLVEQAEAKQAQRQALKAQGKVEEVSKMQWSDVLQEADGRRVKDDPQKLKKQLQKRQAKKKKSQKAWQSRKEQVQSAAQERQQIRQHNLQQRLKGGKAAANLSKKRIETDGGDDGGRRLSRAGFEGRKQDFLNKSGKE